MASKGRDKEATDIESLTCLIKNLTTEVSKQTTKKKHIHKHPSAQAETSKHLIRQQPVHSKNSTETCVPGQTMRKSYFLFFPWRTSPRELLFGLEASHKLYLQSYTQCREKYAGTAGRHWWWRIGCTWWSIKFWACGERISVLSSNDEDEHREATPKE